MSYEVNMTFAEIISHIKQIVRDGPEDVTKLMCGTSTKCAYRKSALDLLSDIEAPACFIGRLFPDEAYDEGMEWKGVSELIEWDYLSFPKLSGNEEDRLELLQEMHDSLYKYENKQEVLEQLDCLASDEMEGYISR